MKPLRLNVRLKPMLAWLLKILLPLWLGLSAPLVLKAADLPVLGTLGGKLALSATEPGRYDQASVKLVAFGYASCQDVCPMILAKYAQVEQHFLAVSEFVSVFVSFDVKRDDGLRLKAHLEKFHGSILGMFGEQAQIDQSLRQFGAAHSPTTGGDFDHTQRLYLLDAEDRVRALFEPHESTEVIVTAIKQLL